MGMMWLIVELFSFFFLFFFFFNFFSLFIKLIYMGFFSCLLQWFQVLLYGGQVVSWKNERREELLFMSSKVNNQKP